ncbi:hypothetical protein FCM35_KLT19227 [Carex littledalei]|uniref:Uncharacterized protein n=1 Tax=Carex littledalei TaxID=544730 RepID=A0A833VF97_9POAL|nr:hypothetical protein FCM35_KLT19227 [Carex littledalei]
MFTLSTSISSHSRPSQPRPQSPVFHSKAPKKHKQRHGPKPPLRQFIKHMACRWGSSRTAKQGSGASMIKCSCLRFGEEIGVPLWYEVDATRDRWIGVEGVIVNGEKLKRIEMRAGWVTKRRWSVLFFASGGRDERSGVGRKRRFNEYEIIDGELIFRNHI